MNSKLDKQRLFNQLFLEVMKWAYSYSIYQWPIFINKFKWRAKQDNSISLYLCVSLSSKSHYSYYQKFWVCVIKKFFLISYFPMQTLKKNYLIISEIPS